MHKRIAIIGTNGSVPESFARSTDTLFEAVGRNTGNLAFQYGFSRHVTGERDYFSFAFQPNQIVGKYDVVCMPAANFLYTGFDLGGLAKRLEDCQLPIVVVGLGAQAFHSINEVKLQPGTERLLHLFSERSVSIAVRGNHTAAVLERYGVKNFDVLGCPSNFINLDPRLGQKISDRVRSPINSMSYCPTFYEYNAKFELDILNSYSDQIQHLICQDPQSAVALARGSNADSDKEWLQKKSGFMLQLDESQQHRRRCELRTFFDASTWMEFYKGQDAIIGSRIHGVNLGWQTERPSALFSYDLRTEELASTMGIPYVKISEISALTEIEKLQDFVGLVASEYDSKRERLAAQYVDFLIRNDLDPVMDLAAFVAPDAGADRKLDAETQRSEKIQASHIGTRKTWGFLEQYNRQRVSGWVASDFDEEPTLSLKINGETAAVLPTFSKRLDLDGFAWNFQFKLGDTFFNQDVVKFEVFIGEGFKQVANSPVITSVAVDDWKKVLVGQDGYLFLQNDANEVLKQITGERLLSEAELDRWTSFFRDLDVSMERSKGVVVHLVAPNKECVLSQRLPSNLKVSEERPVMQLKRLFATLDLKNSRFLYPIDMMKEAADQDAYTRGDSHWSDYGAYLVAQNLFDLLSYDGYIAERPDFKGIDFTAAYRNADLLSKLGNSCIELQPLQKYVFATQKKADNGVVNTGLRRQFESKKTQATGRVQLWHDSFGEWLVPYLAEAFEKSSFVWSPVVDAKTVAEFVPDVIVIEKAERFLVQPGTFVF